MKSANPEGHFGGFPICSIVNAEGGAPLTRSRDAGVEEPLIGSPLKT